MTYKIDKLDFASQYGSFQIFESWKAAINISGSIPTGHYNRYQVVMQFTRDKAKGLVFIQRHDGSIKAPMNAGARLETLLPNYTVYQYASTETVQTDVHYESNGTFLVTNLFIINNTGSTVTLITQTLDIVIDLYDGPV